MSIEFRCAGWHVTSTQFKGAIYLYTYFSYREFRLAEHRKRATEITSIITALNARDPYTSSVVLEKSGQQPSQRLFLKWFTINYLTVGAGSEDYVDKFLIISV